MGKDLIIGGASNYTWDDLKYWVNSIKLSGFSGDIVLVATNITSETVHKLIQENVIVEIYGEQQPDGNFKAHDNGAPHVERFFYIWNYLNKNVDKYDFVISTDTRDVVFQSNPTAWIDESIFHGRESLIVSSEGMRYQDEPWNSQNLNEAFGPYFHKHYKGMLINNVGVLAGETKYMRDLFFMIFQMSINRPIPIVDQVVFNVLLQQQPFKDVVKQTYNSDAWAIQLGTSIEAVKSGKGDLGMMVANDPSKMILYQTKYFDEQPSITDDGIVVNDKGVKFAVVHQYDRTTAWKDKIMARYA
jgi:hypothetical protein